MMTDAATPPSHSRPTVSVVVPFLGDDRAARTAIESLTQLRLRPGDELIVADNTRDGVAPRIAPAGVRVVSASAERSSYHARNVGAEQASGEWVLFLDADCRPEPELIDAYFRLPVDHRVGALAGPIVAAPEQQRLLAEWAASREILSQEHSMSAEPPAAATANLLVRRDAWDAVGGFLEGIRSGGDHEFCWRLHDAGYRLEFRADARVWHTHRERLGAVARQMARYAAGNAWHSRRHPGSAAALRTARKVARAAAGAVGYGLTLRPRRAALKLVDGMAGLAQASGRLLGNAVPPVRLGVGLENAPPIVIATDRFPVPSETFVANGITALTRLGWRVRVEAVARPDRPAIGGSRGLRVNYLEDEGLLPRALASAWLIARHPIRCAADRRLRTRFAPEERMPLSAIAPFARRLARGGEHHVHVDFAALATVNALRAGRIVGTPVSFAGHGRELFVSPLSLPEKIESAAFVIATCEYTKRYMSTLTPAGRDGRIHKMLLGVDGSRFRRARPYPGRRSVVAIGRLVEKKGFADLIAAVALLEARGDPVERLVIGGDGPLRGPLLAQIAANGLEARVELRGQVTPATVRELLEEADLVAVPCVVAADGDRDAMPVVAKEALAMEVPLVATDEVGLPEMVRPEWGRLVPPEDPEALAGAIAEMLALRVEQRAEMGAAGRRFVLEHCNVDRESAKLAQLIADSAGFRAPATRG